MQFYSTNYRAWFSARGSVTDCD